ncbi:MAG: hypothetical protein OXU36_13765 [Candidatus Poribacteria bacterium]|nr:hypothetical protein [Candidatus Poribacteria bacterium]
MRKNITHHKKQIPAEHFPKHGFGKVREGQNYPKQAVCYYIPYSGKESLFRCSTSIWIDQTVFFDDRCLCFEVYSLLNNPEEIAADIERQAEKIICELKAQIEHLTSEIEKYNNQLPGIVEEFFQKRRREFLDQNEVVARLKVPVRKRENLPETYTIPTPKFRKKVNIKPRGTKADDEREPTLDEPIYQNILQIIHDLGKGFEQLPSTYLGKGEEDIRDYIRLFLGLHFEGSTTSETFNKNGKTDILIQHEKSNAFIAECKFWNGKKGYLKTITQLLRYLRWRDSKAAVVMFVRNKNLSSVLQTAKAVTPDHPNHLGFVDKKEDTWFNYRFHINGDPNREVKLGVLFFHIPEQEKP